MPSFKQTISKPARIFFLGITDDMPFSEVQKTFLFNLFLMIGLPFIIAGIPINFSNGQLHLAWFNCVLLLLYSTGLWINTQRKNLWARQLVFVLASVVFMIGPVFFRNGTEYNLLITLIGAVILFDNWLFIPFSLFIIASVTYIRVRDTDLLAIREFKTASPYINIFYSQFLFAICVYAFKYIYFKYQRQLSEAYEKLKQSNEAKDRILRVVAHDLRTPVSGISALSQILIDGKGNPNETKTYLQMIQQASSQSLAMINDLLHHETYRPDELSLHPADINAIITSVFDLMQHKALEKQQVFKLSMQPVALMLECDAEKITRVIQNLVSNAIKFTQKEGEIILSVNVSVNAIGITVKDNGMGIPSQMIKELFDMSVSAKRKGTAGERSFGLGLSVCKQIVEAHHGTIEVDSKEGHGSVFRVQLPVRQRPRP